MRKHILAVSLALACCFGSGEAYARAMTQVSPNIRVGFGPSKQGETGLDTEFIKFVDGTRKTFEGAFFEIRLDSVVDAFIRAKKRGVDIKLVVDNNYYFLPPDPATQDDIDALTPHPIRTPGRRNAPQTDLNPFITRLLQAGIEIVDDNNRSSLMHNKFGVRDGESVWTGSFNLTDTCSYKNPNNAIQVKSKELAAIFRAEFREMFNDRSFGPTSPRHEERQMVKVDDTNIEVFFAPEDNPNSRIAEAISQAEKEIFFMQFAFTADDLRDLLIQKHKSGCDVRGIFDRTLYRSTGPFGEFSHLTEVGVPVKIYPGLGKFHHKVFVVDPEGKDPRVILGSENASTNGNNANDENIMVLHSKKIAGMFKEEFSSYFGSFSDAAAFMQVADLPFAGEPITMGELHIFANGKGIERVKVDYPARWKVEGIGRSAVDVLRGNKNTTEDEKIRFSDNGFVLDTARLNGSGSDSSLTVRFNQIPAPEIAGKYAVLVSVAYKDAPQNYVPLRNNPTVWVFNPEKIEDFTRLLDYIQLLYNSIDSMKGSLNSTQQKNQANIFKQVVGKLQNLICRGVQAGEIQRADMAMKKIESLSQRWRPFILSVSGNLKPLRDALKHRVIHDNDEAAAELLKRVETYILDAVH
ncbi:MAG TPA: phospholipase D-like domain-containing protein [Candidatus Rifleibacterium sp.]|mgnify:CR=1 FL=1|nr:phospholipase D-like domain-containing protein [Candidatus Rifleibacterium sp.]HPT47661.1 phospholipase D-like domain-containing protein [Candidatus Rifleibacterium sp.]